LGRTVIDGYFPGRDPVTSERITRLEELYTYWNARINVISRKDMENLYINHVLHSLSLSRIIPFSPGETAIDIGTGGGFPGIPLAIFHPDVHFTLIDGTGKKIRVVENIAKELNLDNVTALHARAETFKGRFHFVLSRAVCTFTRLIELSKDKLIQGKSLSSAHGIYSFKGGEILDELSEWREKVQIFNIEKFFSEEYFRNKHIVFLPGHKLSRG
jgi:16S rRNA (guanine527-N7)-methyltransferase